MYKEEITGLKNVQKIINEIEGLRDRESQLDEDGQLDYNHVLNNILGRLAKKELIEIIESNLTDRVLFLEKYLKDNNVDIYR